MPCFTDSLGCPSLLPSTASSGLSPTPGEFQSKANEKTWLEHISLDSTSMTRSHPSLQTEVLEEADRDPELMTEERSLKKRTLTERISIKNLEPLHQQALVPPKNDSPMNPFMLGIPLRQFSDSLELTCKMVTNYTA